jgi:hypothetical protein
LVVEVVEVQALRLELLGKILFLTLQLLAHLRGVLLLQVAVAVVQTEAVLLLAGLVVVVF